jgi:hypothetical protein
MRSFVLGVIAFTLIFAIEAVAQMDFQFQGEGEIVAFVLNDMAAQSNGLPTAEVRLSKVVIHNGTYEREIPMPVSEMNRIGSMLKMRFKLYRGPKRLGIYTYEALPDNLKPKKGREYLGAIPVDKDSTIQALTAGTKDQANILNLLNMTVEVAAAAAKNESMLEEALVKAEAEEVAILQKRKLNNAPLIFLPVGTRK